MRTRNEGQLSYPEVIHMMLISLFRCYFEPKMSLINFIGQWVLEVQNYIGYRRVEKKSYTKSMLKTIFKMFFSQKENKKVKSNGEDLRKGNWAEKQIRDMAKLRGKLILM